MYYPVGWPKSVNLALPGENAQIRHICCDAVKILVAAIGDDFLGIWYANPLIPIAYYRRNVESMEEYGTNRLIIWKPDSRQLALLTNAGALLLYQLDFDADGSGILMQVDPPTQSLKRDSAELFIKENIPRLSLREVCSITLGSVIANVCCISLTELLLATEQCELIRIMWTQLEAAAGTASGEEEVDAITAIKLREIPFYVHQQAHLKCLPPISDTAYVASLEYSPFIGGCAAVFSDRRAAFLIANHLRFETENMHGFWVPEVEDATVCSVNHKFRLLAYGRNNSDCAVYAIEDATGGLEFSHRLTLHENVIPGSLGAVNELKWSPDGCVLAVSWQNGGVALWSTFGALLMSTLSWDFGLHVDLLKNNPLQVRRLEWSTEGYQLFMICKPRASRNERDTKTNVLQLNFVKSALSMNPCMASNSHILLQGDDCLYLNQGNNLEKTYFGAKFTFPNNNESTKMSTESAAGVNEDSMELKETLDIASILAESKYWSVLQLPLNYAATNWPIRYAAIDTAGLHLAVAGRTGLAHYSMLTKKWKLFGNESQEKDFVVSGGLLWWQDFIVMGCYSLLDRTDELRCYPAECKLDNQFGHKLPVRAPVICLNVFRNQLIALTADGIVSLFVMTKRNAYALNIECAYELDVKSICIHPACIVSLTVTNLKNELSASAKSVTPTTAANEAAETIIVNVCGRILMIQRAADNNVVNTLLATCLASCVECFWLSNTLDKCPMRDCLWLYSGAHGMRVWLPILPPSNERLQGEMGQRRHTFMSKRIMLSFPLKLYPLVILFDNVIVLGVENETTLYTNETSSHFALPFSVLARKSQVYLHKILRQLIKRNLGYSAWEIAKSCRALPYFPHSLELLLHEVLEEEATSKNPIPDALLPSILDFIREFPVYLQTIVQCARKTEIALWPYLFSMAGKPKELFQLCLQADQLDTAASYLIILQNLEPSVVSKQYATMLLDIALQQRKWELAKDLIRFLKAIDPNEIDSPRSSMVINVKIAPPAQNHTTQVNQNPDVFNMILGPIARERSYSTTVTSNLPKKMEKDKMSMPLNAPATPSTVATSTAEHSATTSSGVPSVVRRKSERSNSTKEKKETFCIDLILQRHARMLLQQFKVIDLGYMCAFLDFHLVSWLSQESERSAKFDDYVQALTTLHEELELPAAFPQRKESASTPDSNPDFYQQVQSQFQLDNRIGGGLSGGSQTSESGYFSLAHMDTPTSMANGNVTQIPCIKEHEELQIQQNACNLGVATKTRANTHLFLDNLRYRRLQDDAYALGLQATTNGVGGVGAGAGSGSAVAVAKLLNDKLSIKLRYLLQLFIEANCVDYALVLSILLQDAASIGRIINVVIRSELIIACQRIELALKHLTQCSYECGDCLYRTFMLTLQPHIYLLDQYILSTAATAATLHDSSNGNLNTSSGSGNKSVDVLDNALNANDETHAAAHIDGVKNFVPNKHLTSAVINGNWSTGLQEHQRQQQQHHHHHMRLTRHASLESSSSAQSLSAKLTKKQQQHGSGGSLDAHAHAQQGDKHVCRLM